MSFGLSPCATCVFSESRKIACPPSCVIPDSNAFRVRVDLSRKSMNSVLSGSSRCGRPVLERRLQLPRDGERLLDLGHRPVGRLDVVAAGEGAPLDRRQRLHIMFSPFVGSLRTVASANASIIAGTSSPSG